MRTRDNGDNAQQQSEGGSAVVNPKTSITIEENYICLCYTTNEKGFYSNLVLIILIREMALGTQSIWSLYFMFVLRKYSHAQSQFP